MAFELSRVDRLTKTYDLAARFPDLDGPFTAASVALLSPRSGPTAATVWSSVSVASGVATVLFAGPDADSTGAVVVPASADLWLKVTDAPETDAKKIERITVIGGGAPLPLGTAATAYQIAVANGFVGTEVEWLASLVGSTGPTGPPGSTGATGATGALGITLVGSPGTPTTNAATARPATSGIVYWLCAFGVNPVNAAAGDLIWNADL